MFLNFFDKRSSSRSPNQSVNDLRLTTPTSLADSYSSSKTAKDHEPDHILITGAGGFIGQDLAAAFLASSPTTQLTLTDINQPPIPDSAKDGSKIRTFASDLTSPSAVSALLSPRFTVIYLLHGLMSGGAEADLDLGWSINWDSHRYIIDYLRAQHPGTMIVFPSSLAVYGPQPKGTVITEDTCPRPLSSYGAQKLMVETYLNDMTRRGLLDGRIVRLPTVIVRPGAPSAAASSFCSGIVREPLKGREAILPVSRKLELWVSSPATVVENLMRIRDTPTSWFGKGRVVNLPGITVTVQDILDALKEVGGDKAAALVKDKRDEKIEGIVGNWPAKFDTQHAWMLGMKGDIGLTENVRAFAKKYGLTSSGR